MVDYPISVRRQNYHGANQKLRAKAAAHNRDASQLEKHVNALLLKQVEPIRVYLWHEIAPGVGLPYDVVAELGYSIDAGSNGFTAIKPGMSYPQAIAAIDQHT